MSCQLAILCGFYNRIVSLSEWLVDNVVTPPSADFKQLHINTVLFEGAPVKVIREIRDTVNMGGLGGLESKFATREWGVAMMDGVTDWMVRYLEAFRRIDLPKKHWD